MGLRWFSCESLLRHCEDDLRRLGLIVENSSMTWNPVGRVGPVPLCGDDPAAVVGLCRVNCNALWPGFYLCVGV